MANLALGGVNLDTHTHPKVVQEKHKMMGGHQTMGGAHTYAASSLI